MRNISISFIPPEKNQPRLQPKKSKQAPKKSSLQLISQYINQLNQKPGLNFRPISQRRAKHPTTFFESGVIKISPFEQEERKCEKSRFLYQSMMMHLNKTFLEKREVPKQDIELGQFRDRTKIIHSRNHPRSTLWKRKSKINISNHEEEQKKLQPKIKSLINLINPEECTLPDPPQSKKMQLFLKKQRFSEIIVRRHSSDYIKKSKGSSPSSPINKHKFWNKTYRPWSPQRRPGLGLEQFCQTVDPFIETS